ncbi:MAG: hypothetical protein K0S44_2906 [Bacteroidetes bacterium]|jgi:hypothetical protein|nr:hypothetical protein [Bacteroidota bacterium]
MDTAIKSQTLTSTKENVQKTVSINPFWEKIEFNRFGIIPMLLVVITCMGGIAVAFGAGSDTFELALVVFPTIISLALVLAVAPMRLIIWSSIMALILDLIVFVI